MMQITRLAAVDGGDGVSVTVKNGGEIERYTLSAGDYADLALRKGELSEEVYSAIQRADARYRAVRAAIRLLAAGQCSRRKLAEKLRARHFAPEDADFAVRFAAENGYIDENWQIESYLKVLFLQKHYGLRRILPALYAKGYATDRVRSLFEARYTEADIRAAKSAFLEKKFGKRLPETAEEARAMKAALYKQGF